MFRLKNINRLAFYAAVISAISVISTAHAGSMLPKDVQKTCAVSSSEFNSWFIEGKPTAQGWVKPANSVDFTTNNTVCDFYKWGAQMFLWLTSPEGDGLVLDGEAIINVLPADDQGKRYLQKNRDGVALPFSLRREKFDDIGEVGQAGGSGVLMSQGKSLVYYGVHINNVYAYFLTGQKTGKFPDMKKFPRNNDDLQDVEKFVASNYPNTWLVAKEALVMELKSSWVEASTLSNPEDFIQMNAVIPTYTPNSNNTTWKKTSTKPAKLALVGMHVVGTVQNHPEFVWSSFEHINNAPDAKYYYYNSKRKLQKTSYSSAGNFVFMASGGSENSANTECMKEDKGDINAVESNGKVVCGGVVPSNTVRVNPWGNAPTAASATNNTLLLSNNNSIINQLSNGDLRKNYIQIGGIWTSAPTETSDAPIPDTNDFNSTDLRGSLILANSTMETYNQPLDCFTCHEQSKTAPDSFQPFELSHIYSQIVPLPMK